MVADIELFVKDAAHDKAWLQRLMDWGATKVGQQQGECRAGCGALVQQAARGCWSGSFVGQGPTMGGQLSFLTFSTAGQRRMCAMRCHSMTDSEDCAVHACGSLSWLVCIVH